MTEQPLAKATKGCTSPRVPLVTVGPGVSSHWMKGDPMLVVYNGDKTNITSYVLVGGFNPFEKK